MLRALGLVISVLALASCGSGDEKVEGSPPESTTATADGADSFNVGGSMTITDPSGYTYLSARGVGAHCTGDGGYDDIREGAQVVIRDSTGTQLAFGELGPGLIPDPATSIVGCSFSLLVFAVPVTSTIYTVEVSHRGEISFSQEEAESGLNLTLG